jgi:REP-associated tyrosine transposase
MSQLKHRTHPGSSYFITTKCAENRSIFQIPDNAKILVDTLFQYRNQSAYQLHEFVVMPNHLHLLLTPGESISLEKCVQLIKGASSHEIHKQRHHKLEIWQKSFHDWTIRDESDWNEKAEYIRMNPVRAKLVENPGAWLFSSANKTFLIDPMPATFKRLSSAAEAAPTTSAMLGLKPQPPKEHRTKAHSA